MHTKNKLILLATALFSVTTFAGYSQHAPVLIRVFEDGSGLANGDMSTARNSLNEFAFIGCGIRTYDFLDGQTYTNGFCQAGLEEEVSYTCFTENPLLLDAINGLSDLAYISFSWFDDGSGNLTCTRVGSSTQSFYLEEGRRIK